MNCFHNFQRERKIWPILLEWYGPVLTRAGQKRLYLILDVLLVEPIQKILFLIQMKLLLPLMFVPGNLQTDLSEKEIRISIEKECIEMVTACWLIWQKKCQKSKVSYRY